MRRRAPLFIPVLLLAALTLPAACRRAEPTAEREPAPASAERGHALLTATRDSLPQHVGNRLRCTSCHLDDGRNPRALPWTGVTSRYPQYRSRNDAVSTIEDRINDCFERSMNGSAVARDSRDMRDMVAYLASLPADSSADAGPAAPMTPLLPDTARGAALFASTCAACHGGQGEGTAVAPALWGAQSYNIGAGMARLRTAAAFIRHNMPRGGATLGDQQAFDVAAYVNSRPRPDFPGKEHDWPRGDAPPDVPYETDAARSAPARPARH
jgi:thiosulfate dehydrogenase